VGRDAPAGAARPSSGGNATRPSSAGPKATKLTAKLQVVRADSAQQVIGKSFGLTAGKPNVIGRDPQVDIAIPSDRISRRHCQLEPTPDGVFVLTDLGSSNGTLVNQEKIGGRKVLLGGEYIQIGDVLLRFLDQ
jgi:pSer/pThr/pTyr-binding forkhead associated (FHA) protein